jgi:cyclin A
MRMCTDYVNDVYTNAQIKQLKHSPNPQYMELHQKEITVTMRGILVDWLVEVAVEYQQSQETLFLSIGYIDAYLSKARCVRSKLQLVGITCMHIASKYQEIYPPSMNDFCYITDNTYDREDLISMERRVLGVLDYELSVPTTWMFLMRFLRVGEADRSTEYMGMYLAELSLLEYNLLQHLPSQVAASAVLLALYNNHKPHWSTTLEHYTGYTPRALRQCVITLHKALREARPSTTLPAIGEKYSKEQTGSVSSLAVRELNLAIFDQPY